MLKFWKCGWCTAGLYQTNNTKAPVEAKKTDLAVPRPVWEMVYDCCAIPSCSILLEPYFCPTGLRTHPRRTKKPIQRRSHQNALTQSRRVPPKYKSRPCPKGTRFERLTSIVVKKGRRKETQWKCFKRKPTRILSWQQNNQKCWESRWSITMGFDTNATLMSPFLNYSPNMVRPVGQSSVITFLFEDPSNRRDS